MGEILSYKHGEGSVKNLDPRLWDIAQASIAAMPYDAQIRSAAERGKGDKGNHSGGFAIDVTFFDKNGNRIPDTGKTGGANSAAIYEQWAQTARAIQQQKYPELDRTFRWGGGFRQGYPFDFMHLDITPSRGGAMAYYNWDTGWNAAAANALPGLKPGKNSGHPVPPLGLNNEAFPVTASRQIDQKRMQFEAALQNTPMPRPRPTPPTAGQGGVGQPTQTIDPAMRNAISALPNGGATPDPQPATMSPALQAARQRLAAAREQRTNAAASGETSAAAMAATPRLTSANGEITGIEDTRPSLDWGQFKPSVSAGGVGSLLDGSMSPGALNPAKPPVAGPRLPTSPTTITGRPDAPVGALPAARTGTTVTGRPDAPIGALPAAVVAGTDPRDRTSLRAASSIASGPAAGRPGGATSVPMDGGKIDNGGAGSSGTPQAVAREPQMVTVNGKSVPVGATVIQGNVLKMVVVGADGNGALRNVEDIRDDWLRQNVDQNAPLLFDKGALGAGARALAAPRIKQGIADAGTAARDAAGNLISGVVSTTGGLLQGAKNTLGGLFSPSSSSSSAAVSPVFNSNAATLASARLEQMAARGNTLTPAAPKTITTTITNPAYTEWVKKYGDGSQVQTAATGGMITKDQLAAIQNVNGAVQAPIKKAAIPPAPPKTITVKKPANTLAAPVPAARPAAPQVQTAQTLSGRTVNVGQTYQSGGYLYTANPNGSFIKVGKVGTPSSNVLSALSTSQPTSAQAYAAANAGPGSVAAMEQQHSGRPAGSYTDSREASGTGSLW